ncbi:hypothetical protein [Rhodococcus sp. NPDC060176]|uniref:hypothetical protein n=1 Tax=Rhodococcus sp. NPDC060176 TaxID=3347062 RepID=UPI00365F4142
MPEVLLTNKTRRPRVLLAVLTIGVVCAMAGCSSDDTSAPGLESTTTSVVAASTTAPPPTPATTSETVESSNSVGGGADTSTPGAPAGDAAPAWTPVSTSAVAPAGPGPSTESTRCTDQINYAGDPRSNAEINSIGERMGSCPAPLPPDAVEPSEKCTDQINYGADPRSNAEINIIGEQTGICPEPIRP